MVKVYSNTYDVKYFYAIFFFPPYNCFLRLKLERTAPRRVRSYCVTDSTFLLARSTQIFTYIYNHNVKDHRVLHDRKSQLVTILFNMGALHKTK